MKAKKDPQAAGAYRSYFGCLLIVAGWFMLTLLGCQSSSEKPVVNKDRALIKYVNPFIGTGGHGHTYPGATMPFGMMQLSPDTRLDGWDGCSGYHYSDSIIYGFSHTHLSGTGVSDYGDVLLMPSTQPFLGNGAQGKKGYRDYFSHKNEIAEPAYYQVHLDSSDIKVQLTVTERCGMHQYEFPFAERQYIILDLTHRDKLLGARINPINKREINGFRFSEAWAKEQKLYYYIRFSQDIKNIIYDNEEQPKVAAIEIENPENKPVFVSVGISPVDEEGAHKNLEHEIGTASFEEIKEQAQKSWEQQLEKILVESKDKDQMTIFYTALYHSMLAPNLYQDVDGKYRGMGLEIHQTKDFDYYTVFSLWDTYRATHPLYTILEQERTNDFINTFLAKYEEGGIMPIWDLSANYTGCMIGYHAVPVIADAYLKGIRGYDAQLALEAMKHSATRDKLGLESYKKYGFIPMEMESESVSKTLEYAYDDWTIAQMAKELDQQDDYDTFIKRAQYFKNVYDPNTKFMRGRIENKWFAPFDPYEVNFNYTEANAWQYSYYVPQDISGLMELMGGKESLEAQLDAIFTAKAETSGRNQADITGLIGQYAHGNEPSHHIAYLYNFVNKPHKTQQYVHQIMTQLYSNAPDGISGNEDCGQMSAWYVFSALGFYPVTPASNQYIIGTPLLDKASLELENGNRFTIEARNLSPQNKYIKSVTLNGKPHPQTFIRHQEIMNGGHLVFEMTDRPSSWGTEDKDIPVTSIPEEYEIVAVPYIEKGAVAFKEQTEVALNCATDEAVLYYSIDHKPYRIYNAPFIIDERAELEVYAEKDGQKSAVFKTTFFKIDSDISIKLMSSYANQYNAGGDHALIDGRFGANDFKTGNWQGYFGEDVEAVIDLGAPKTIEAIKMGFLQDQRSWIFYPSKVEFWASTDGQNFQSLGVDEFNALQPSEEVGKKEAKLQNLKTSARYIKVKASSIGDLPSWHLGYEHGGQAWIFTDEIVIDERKGDE